MRKKNEKNEMMNELDPLVNIVVRSCPRCKKKFCPAPYHVYRDEKGYYCSWTCYNHKDDKPLN